MATASTLALSNSLPIKYVPFDPSVLKRKTKSKRKAKNKPNIMERSLYRDGSYGSDGDGEWPHIDDFSIDLADSKALHSLDVGIPAVIGASGPSGLLHPDGEGDNSTVPPPQMPQDQQPAQEEPCYPASVEEIDFAVDGLFDGSSPGLPLVLHKGAARASHSIDNIQSSGRTREYRNDDLGAAGTLEFSVDNTAAVYSISFSEQDTPYDDVERNQQSATHKRNYASFAGTTTPIEVRDYTSESASEDPRLTKRRSTQPQAGSYASGPVFTPISSTTTLPQQARESHLSPFRVSNGPNAGDVNNSDNNYSADTSDLPRSDLLDLHNGGDGVHHEGVTDNEPLQPLKQSTSPSERREGDQDFSPDSECVEEKSNARNGAIRESHDSELDQADEMLRSAPENGNHSDEDACDSEDELGQFDKVPHRTMARPSQRRGNSDLSAPKKRHSSSRTHFRRSSTQTIPIRPLQEDITSKVHQHSQPKIDDVTQSHPPRTSSTETRPAHEISRKHESSVNLAYQISDFSLCHVPMDSPIVTACVRCSESELPSAPYILGKRCQTIRIIQVSQDSWLFLGYQYNGGATNLSTYESMAGLSSRQISNPHTCPAMNHNVDRPGNEARDEEVDNDNDNDEDLDTLSDTAECRKTHVRWLASDEQRLLAYRDTMKMQWGEIFKYFPERTRGAVRTRYHMLHGK